MALTLSGAFKNLNYSIMSFQSEVASIHMCTRGQTTAGGKERKKKFSQSVSDIHFIQE